MFVRISRAFVRSAMSTLPGLLSRRFSISARSQLATLLRGPALFVELMAARNAQRFRRNIFCDGRSSRDVRAVTDFYRRDQHRIAADKNAIADSGLMFVHAIVIASDRAGPDEIG